jgi:alpha-D-ribose 1-methylphosphonate 5-triphosphate synthase subunit PhnG
MAMTEGSQAHRPNVGPFRTFWIYLSGQSMDLAAENDEVNLYARYGALTFASAMLATAIGFCFVFFAITPPGAHGSELPRLLAATGAGLLVGRSILAMDQFIVAYVPTNNGIWHKLANFLARGLATTALVFVGSWTLTPLLASGLVNSYLQQHRHLVPTRAEQLAVGAAQTRLGNQGRVIRADQVALTSAQTELSAEEQGHGPSHIAGCGRACRADTVALQQAQRQLDADRAQREPLLLALAKAKQAEIRDLATQQAKPIDADVFSRHAALSAIERKDSSVAWLDWLVTFLIAAIDLGPVLMKSFSDRSATDESVLATRQRKQDVREIERDFHRNAAVSGSQQAAPAAAEYQRVAFEAEARYESETRTERAAAKRAPRRRTPRRPAYGGAHE